MTDLAKRLIIAIVLFFLVAFGYTQMVKASKAQAEADRLAEVNAVLDSTATMWQDSTAVLDPLLALSIERGDSLARRTGPIRWRTRTVTVIEPGRTDTLFVTDSVPVVEIDSQLFEIPVQVAEELQACRLLAQDCETFREVADSTIKWQATSIDSLNAQVENLNRRFKVPQLAMFGLSLPLPGLTLGYGVMYSMNGCSESVIISPNEFDAILSRDCDRIHHGPTIGLSWKVWSP